MTDSNTGAAAQKPTSSVKLVLLGEAAVGKSSLVLRFVNNDFQENKEPTIGAAFLTQKCNLPKRTIKFEIWDTAGQERFASLAPMYYRNAQAALVVYDLTKASSLTKAQHWVAELQRQASPGIVIALVGNKYDLTNAASGGGLAPASATTTTAASPVKSATGAGTGSADKDDDEDAGVSSGPGASVDPTGEDDDDDDDDDDRVSDARQVSTKQAKSYADDEGLLFFETSAKTGMNVTDVFTAIANAIPETQLKGPRASGQAGSGSGGRQADTRLDLTAREAAGAKEGCAC